MRSTMLKVLGNLDRQQTMGGITMIVVCGMLFALFAICFLSYLNASQNQVTRVIQGKPYDEIHHVQREQDGNSNRLDVSTRTKDHGSSVVRENGLPEGVIPF